jgi:hypothetical protein
MMTVADNDDMQDWAADCNGEGRERAVRDIGDSKVAMMAAVAEDGGGERRWWRWTTTAMAVYDSSGQRRRQMMTACKIERRTMRGKEESG